MLVSRRLLENVSLGGFEMPSQASSLSIAIQEFANYLAAQLGDKATILVDTPQKANDQAKGSLTDLLNIFVYRIAPSGFHADLSQNEPTFVRANVLLTPFPRSTGDDGETDLDLRVLGHALAVLQSAPVIPITLPAPLGSTTAAALNPQTTFYQLQAVLQAPAMEEMNHIWTTQGGDLGYRLSAAYELALIPIEPLDYVAPAAEVRAAVVGVASSISASNAASPVTVTAPEAATTWVPSIMFHFDGTLTNIGRVAPATPSVEIALAGLTSADAEINVDWVRADASVQSQSAQSVTISGSLLDTPEAIVTINLTSAAAGDVARISARPGGATSSSAGNVLELTIVEGA